MPANPHRPWAGGNLAARRLDAPLFGALAFALFAAWRIVLMPGGAWLIVAASGAAVGAIELLGRYPYAPLRAVFSGSGLVYVVVNVLASVAAYHVVGKDGFHLFAATTPPEKKHLFEIFTAGFGALVFMRSSVFKTRVGDAEVGIGPAALLDTLLLSADRGVDRQEAALRAQEVSDLLKGVDPVRGAKLLVAYCIALMQNVTTDEQKRLDEKITRVAAEGSIDEAIRLDLIALHLSGVVGPGVLEAAINALGERLKNPTQPQSQQMSGGAAGSGGQAVPQPAASTPQPPSSPTPAGRVAIPVPSPLDLISEIEALKPPAAAAEPGLNSGRQPDPEPQLDLTHETKPGPAAGAEPMPAPPDGSDRPEPIEPKPALDPGPIVQADSDPEPERAAKARRRRPEPPNTDNA